MDLQPEAAYRQYHIPGAVHSDYGRWRRPDAKGTKQMLPPAADLESLIGGLGVGPGIHVVLVVTGRGPGEMGGGASFHSPANLRRIYRAAGVPPTGDQIVFCHTGHRAALAWFVTHELLGNSGARLYDGSTAEWAADPALPMERKIDLE
jgi:3-mercaptopyruvate sulfurtransferase SseA